jgi:hypothetical protein
MARIESYQRNKRKHKVASAALSIAVFDSMIRCAELMGYESVSDFVRDSILDKMSNSASAMLSIINENRVMKVE